MKKKISLSLAFVLALSLCAGCGGGSEDTADSQNLTTYVTQAELDAELSQPTYPETVECPDMNDYLENDGTVKDEYWEVLEVYYEAERQANEVLAGVETDAVGGFCRSAMTTLLSDAQGENRVISPVNLYMALAMLAEITDGNTRQQVLDLLGAQDVEQLQDQISALVEGETQNREGRVAQLAASLWLDQDLAYQEGTVSTLADRYYAAVYQGDMGSDSLNEVLQSWLNRQTHGLLEDQVSGQKFDPETVLALATTIYYKAQWDSKFLSDLNTEDLFHGAAGDTTVTYMHQSPSGDYYWGDQFSAVSLSLSGGDSMWLILPNEGVEVESLLGDDQVDALLSGSAEELGWKYAVIHESIPQFDVSDRMDLTDGLHQLGITDAFVPGVADFSPLVESNTDSLALTEATHAARVKIDEEGVEAAAYTLMAVTEAALLEPEEEVDFVLDRPFLFAVQDRTGLLLFAGVVNQVE